jgi:hypothetical protein
VRGYSTDPINALYPCNMQDCAADEECLQACERRKSIKYAIQDHVCPVCSEEFRDRHALAVHLGVKPHGTNGKYQESCTDNAQIPRAAAR